MGTGRASPSPALGPRGADPDLISRGRVWPQRQDCFCSSSSCPFWGGGSLRASLLSKQMGSEVAPLPPQHPLFAGQPLAVGPQCAKASLGVPRTCTVLGPAPEPASSGVCLGTPSPPAGACRGPAGCHTEPPGHRPLGDVLQLSFGPQPVIVTDYRKSSTVRVPLACQSLRSLVTPQPCEPILSPKP